MSGIDPETGGETPQDRLDAGPELLLLALGPLLWSVQLLVGYGVASHACFPSYTPWMQSPPPGWAGLPGWLVALNLAAAAGAAAGAFVAWRRWRRLPAEIEAPARTHLETGKGRARFLTLCATLTAAGFAIAVLFNTVGILWIPSCWQM